MRNHRSHSAFTFIELMVVVTVIIIMAGGALAAYFNFNKTETLNSDIRILVAEISKIRSKAANMEYPVGCTSGLESYRVRSALVNSVNSGIVVSANCGGTVLNQPPVPNPILQNSNFTAAWDISFAAGSGYISDGQDRTLTLRSTQDTSLTKNIVINRLGIIQ